MRDQNIFRGRLMKKLLRIILDFIGIALLLDASFLAFIINFNFGIIITYALGLAFLLYGIYFEKINATTDRGLLKWLKYAVFTGSILTATLITFLAVYGNVDTVTYEDEHAVIVLGAGINGETPTLPLIHRLDKAVEYHSKNPGAVIVVSGGRGFQETITEALAMEQYLMMRGISREKIIKEEKATSTYENFVYSKELLNDHFSQKPYKAVIITNDFHIYRAHKIAEIVGLDCTKYHAKKIGTPFR